MSATQDDKHPTPMPTPTLRLGSPTFSGIPPDTTTIGQSHGVQPDAPANPLNQIRPYPHTNGLMLHGSNTTNKTVTIHDEQHANIGNLPGPSLSTRSTMRAPLGTLLATPVHTEFRPELEGGFLDGRNQTSQLRHLGPDIYGIELSQGLREHRIEPAGSPTHNLVLSPVYSPGYDARRASDRDAHSPQEADSEHVGDSEAGKHLYCHLSATSWLFMVLQAIIWAAWALMSESKTALVYPALLAPALPVAILWWRNRALLPLDEIVVAFAQGFSPAGVLIFCCQLMFCMIAIAVYSFLFFNEERFIFDRPLPALVPLYLLIAFVIHALLEELSKYRIIMMSESRRLTSYEISRQRSSQQMEPVRSSHLEDPDEQAAAASSSPSAPQATHITRGKEKLLIMTAMTSGFATGLTVFAVIFYSLLYDSALAMLSQGGAGEASATRKAQKVTTLLSLAFALTALNTPSQLLSGYLISLRIVLREYYRRSEFSSVWRIIRYPMFVRGLGYFQSALCFSGFFGEVNSVGFWFALLIPSILIFAELWRKTRSTERELPPEYLRRVGSLTESYSLLGDEVTEPQSPVSSTLPHQPHAPTNARREDNLAIAMEPFEAHAAPNQTTGAGRAMDAQLVSNLGLPVPQTAVNMQIVNEAKNPNTDTTLSLLNDDDLWTENYSLQNSNFSLFHTPPKLPSITGKKDGQAAGAKTGKKTNDKKSKRKKSPGESNSPTKTTISQSANDADALAHAAARDEIL